MKIVHRQILEGIGGWCKLVFGLGIRVETTVGHIFWPLCFILVLNFRFVFYSLLNYVFARRKSWSTIMVWARLYAFAVCFNGKKDYQVARITLDANFTHRL